MCCVERTEIRRVESIDMCGVERTEICCVERTETGRVERIEMCCVERTEMCCAVS